MLSVLTGRLTAFVNTLPKSNIRFLYFAKAHVTDAYGNVSVVLKPMIITYLGEWMVDGKPYYVAPGETREYCYVYPMTSVRYMVTMNPMPIAASPRRFVASFVGNQTNRVRAYHGNHLTMGVGMARQGSGQQVVVKSHATTYVQFPGSFEFDREETICNFMGRASYAQYTPAQFGQIKCDRGTDPTIQDAYRKNAEMADVLYHLYGVLYPRPVAATTTPGGGGGGSRLYTGRNGGRYRLDANGRKRYLSRGGAAAVRYGGLTLEHPETLAFLTEQIFSKVDDARADLEGVRVFLDETGSLGRGAEQRLVVLYEFGEDRQMAFYADMLTTLMAARAWAHPGDATTAESQAMASLLAASASFGRGGPSATRSR